MTRGQKKKRREIKDVTGRKDLFGGSGFVTMPRSDTNRFDIVIYKNSLKSKRQEVKNYEYNYKQTYLHS